jgi:hypothetical protein
MRMTFERARRQLALTIPLALFAPGAMAADHLDTPTVEADPSADIGDLFAWVAEDGKRLNLVMDIVGRRFSDRIQYVFHVDSGSTYGKTAATTAVLCRFDAGAQVECWAGDVDYARGDASSPQGLESRRHKFRVFAGLRDDPYFNNVRGTRTALNTAAGFIKQGAPQEVSGYYRFDGSATSQILAKWRQTNAGPAANFLAGWKTSALVVSIDMDVVKAGGPMLAVWGRTYRK